MGCRLPPSTPAASICYCCVKRLILNITRLQSFANAVRDIDIANSFPSAHLSVCYTLVLCENEFLTIDLYSVLFVFSRHETDPTVVVLIDRRHSNWSSVKSILQAISVSPVVPPPYLSFHLFTPHMFSYFTVIYVYSLLLSQALRHINGELLSQNSVCTSAVICHFMWVTGTVE